ncbi:efflux RND transporter periplasmic adaptor subunit [Paenibacillus filicis]|uniref:Efflux RND transporter periplasmic adaptor subunit n=1 Tax=Paenibacillus gyeongsangnamensis TaxID=3388067 RepID=A0ABT4Q8M5_9BACL|nr:efflux RND transporter periplasmic adaptor subunit [Paenibacillus filicis]MCZ8513141.1 efflux RND transporter periplasmic adaptor subunit [Paenibacillus filicis]
MKTVKVRMQAWDSAKELAANVIPSLEINIVLKVDGDALHVLKKRGDTVQKDDVIIELDKKDMMRQKQKLLYEQASLEEQLTKAKRDLNDSMLELTNNLFIAKQNLDDTTKQYNKTLNDYDVGLATKQQKEQLESQVNNLKLNLQILQQKLDTLKNSNPLSSLQYQLQANEISMQDVDSSISNFDVKAPTAGILTEMPIEEGITLARGQKIGVVQRQNPIKIRAEVTETDLPFVQGKQTVPFKISGSPDKLQGKVTYLANVADSQTRTYALELEAANDDGRLKSGMRVQLILADNGQQQVVAVPADSILRQEGEPFVYIVNGDHAEKRMVKLGRSKESIQEVVAGLQPGDVLVVSGQYQLQNMEKVKPSE